jgi:hypothetical protein
MMPVPAGEVAMYEHIGWWRTDGNGPSGDPDNLPPDAPCPPGIPLSERQREAQLAIGRSSRRGRWCPAGKGVCASCAHALMRRCLAVARRPARHPVWKLTPAGLRVLEQLAQEE